MVLKIAQLGQPVLWQKAAAVPHEEFASEGLQQFLGDMKETLEQSGGVGLAAPQVFRSQRVFLAAIFPPASPEEPPGVEVFINPRIVESSEEMSERWEGCLSFSELMVLVERPIQVRIEYFDAQGRPRELQLRDFPARVIQHEYDHLDGILTIDRAKSTHHIIKTSEYPAVLQESGS